MKHKVIIRAELVNPLDQAIFNRLFWFRATCSCLWSGPIFKNQSSANTSKHAHLTAAKQSQHE